MDLLNSQLVTDYLKNQFDFKALDKVIDFASSGDSNKNLLALREAFPQIKLVFTKQNDLH